MDREFGGLYFTHICVIEPDRDVNGAIREFMPQDRYANLRNLPLNAHGDGPFCKFKISKSYNQSGIYVLTLNGDPKYVGKCDNLAQRWGLQGYGTISPKNCFMGGQSTNCKINNMVLRQSKRGGRMELLFHATMDPGPVERTIILILKPEWNLQIPW